jgi:hypothetical protein
VSLRKCVQRRACSVLPERGDHSGILSTDSGSRRSGAAPKAPRKAMHLFQLALHSYFDQPNGFGLIMGGIGSGWHRGARPRCERRGALNLAKINIGETWLWYGPDRRAATLTADAAGVWIIHHRCDERGRCVSEIARERAPFHYLPVHFGGMRRLSGCPNCGGRCRFLYDGAGRFWCRICLGLRHSSENLGTRGRIWWRIMKTRRRVEDNATVDGHEFPERRPRMKRRTYERLLSLTGRIQRSGSASASFAWIAMARASCGCISYQRQSRRRLCATCWASANGWNSALRTSSGAEPR